LQKEGYEVRGLKDLYTGGGLRVKKRGWGRTSHNRGIRKNP